MITRPNVANILGATMIALADGTPITTGTVNFYMLALSGANAGKWWNVGTNLWSATEVVAAVGTHKARGHWTATPDLTVWADAVAYRVYTEESGGLSVAFGYDVFCDAQAAATAAASYAASALSAASSAQAVVNSSSYGNAAIKAILANADYGNAALLAAIVGAALTAQQTRDAMKLAPTEGAPVAGSIDQHLDALATILSGITSLANWLRGLFRKDAMNATAKTEVNTGGGTFDETTDSEQALADAIATASAFRITGSVGTYTLAGATVQPITIPQYAHTDLALVVTTSAGVPIDCTGKTIRFKAMRGSTAVMDFVSTDATEIEWTNQAAGAFILHFTAALTVVAERLEYELWNTTAVTGPMLWAKSNLDVVPTIGPA